MFPIAYFLPSGSTLNNGGSRGKHRVAVTSARAPAPNLAAFGLASLVGLEGTARDVTILIAGMPAAVNTTILTARLGADVPLAVRIVVVSTSLSIVTLTALLTIL